MTMMLLALTALGCKPTLTLFVPEDPIAGTIEVSAEGNFDRLVLMLDGAVLDGGEGPSISATWDSTTVEDGVHQVRGAGFNGNRAPIEEVVEIEVSQADGDVIAPQVFFQSPAEGQNLGGEEVRVELNITENVGLESVAIYGDGDILASLPPEGPWELIWENVTLGDHCLEAQVMDLAGNEGGADVCFTVTDGETSTDTAAEGFMVLITDPVDGSVLPSAGTGVPLKAAVGGGEGADSATLYINGDAQETLTNDWQWNWDATAYLGEVVELEVVGVERNTGAEASDSITVTVPDEADTGGPDPEGCVVLITDPIDGSTLDMVGTGVPLKAAIGGGAGAESATLFVNDIAQDTLTAGWQWNWDATPYVGTEVSLEVVGIEIGTGAEASDAITVIVPDEG